MMASRFEVWVVENKHLYLKTSERSIFVNQWLSLI